MNYVLTELSNINKSTSIVECLYVIVNQVEYPGT